MMPVSLALLKAGGSCYTVEEVSDGFILHAVSRDQRNFNIIGRRLMDEAGETYVAFPRRARNGNYDCIHILPHEHS
jgi:hypothetical protein